MLVLYMSSGICCFKSISNDRLLRNCFIAKFLPEICWEEVVPKYWKQPSYIKSYINDNIPDWDTYLKYFAYFHYTSTSSIYDNKFTPNELVFGRRANIPNDFNLNKIDTISNGENFTRETKFRPQSSHILKKTLLEKHKIRNKEQHDKLAKPSNFKLNSKVFLKKFNNIIEGLYIISLSNGI